jgi:hypothetical protein
MASRYLKTPQVLETGMVTLFGTVTFGASGAISASDTKGFSVAKTATKTGRYTVTLEDGYNGLRGASVTMEGVADTAFGANGYIGGLRNVDVANKTLDVQITDAAGADTNPASGYKCYIALHLKNTSVNY